MNWLTEFQLFDRHEVQPEVSQRVVMPEIQSISQILRSFLFRL